MYYYGYKVAPLCQLIRKLQLKSLERKVGLNFCYHSL